MSDILSQAEIEMLLASLDSGEPDLATAASSGPAPVARPSAMTPAFSMNPLDKGFISYAPYDFRRPDKFAKDQIRTFHMLHEAFARLFASSLSAYLRTPVHVDLVSVEQMPYDEYMRSLTHSVINVFSMAPLTGQAILEMELNLVFSMIDRLLGGPGSVSKTSASLTDIERALTESIVNRALTNLQSAWDGVAQFFPKRERLETQSQFVQIIPPNDVIVSILFEMKVGDLRGAMSVCIPYLLLKPITHKLSAQRWFSNNSKKLGQFASVLTERIASTYINCTVRLGGTTVSVEDLLHLQAGDVLILDRRQDEEVEALIGNRIKFRGKPGIKGKKLALYVTRVTPEPDPIEVNVRNADFYE